MDLSLDKLEVAARKALEDTRAASARIQQVNNEMVALIEATKNAKTQDEADLAVARADSLKRKAVYVRAAYQKSVEFATLLQAMVNLKKAGKEDEVKLGANVLKRMSRHKWKVKLPPDQQRKTSKPKLDGHLGLWPFDGTDLGTHVNAATKDVGRAFNDAGQWIGQNGGQIAAVALPIIGTAAGAYFGGPQGASMGLSLGSGLASAFQGAKPGVVNGAPPPSTPMVGQQSPYPQQPGYPGMQVPNFAQAGYPGAGLMPQFTGPNAAALQQQWLLQQQIMSPLFNDPTRAAAMKTGGVFDLKKPLNILTIGGAAAAVLLIGVAAVSGDDD